jgi:His-Xaa-Ser system radical SAM maturase HxsB
VEQRSIAVAPPELAAEALGFFRWGRIGGRILITTDAGDWELLGPAEFDDLLAGRLAAGHERFDALQRKGFLRDGLDLDQLATRIAERTVHLRRGPHVHVLTLTLRRAGGANGRPVDAGAADMDKATAEKVVEFALESTSPSIAFEFQGDGGEPLLNFDVLRHVVEFARARSQHGAGKKLRFSALSNFTAMTDEAAEWLIANDVLVSTVLDGPASVHDGNRQWLAGSAHADVVRWIEYFTRRYGELGRDPRQWPIDARVTVTRNTLAAAREVVDEYVARGLRSIDLRPLTAARYDPATWAAIGYGVDEYLAFYRRTLDYIVELNRRGSEIVERTASIVLAKILTGDDPGIVDLQSPCGAGTGEVAYGVDGRVFPCDEARWVDAGGDPLFELGSVDALSISDIAGHPTVRAIAAASLLDAQPMCADCWNKPFCGFNPVRNFISQGDLFGQRPHCFECKEHMAVSRQLFELLGGSPGAEATEILKRWTATRSPLAVDGRLARDVS